MLDCNHNSGPAVLSPHNNAVIQANAASLPRSRGTFWTRGAHPKDTEIYMTLCDVCSGSSGVEGSSHLPRTSRSMLPLVLCIFFMYFVFLFEAASH